MSIDMRHQEAVPTVQEMISKGYFIDVSAIVPLPRHSIDRAVITRFLHDKCRNPQVLDNLFRVSISLFIKNSEAEASFEGFSDSGNVIGVRASICSDGAETFLVADIERSRAEEGIPEGFFVV